ncbi:beta-galactosidase-1-like protein 2 isoform X3 [Anneissia japonica]|uniref:beta-galactosidase-1-like protein 2 isoform X3 n=1 Tax=Anneissia japonica TaxID=1529436 RepID=UPI001425A38E|nr:beta-galactosidase-1-like protein 2 isoform X3 [Anneissia japonica]
MNAIKKILLTRGVKEKLLTSGTTGYLEEGYMPGVLMTVNFYKEANMHFGILRKLQGDDVPLMVMEYWLGWFDHWSEQHHIFPWKGIILAVKEVLELGASINFYMFHGGTTFGFWNGANIVNHLTYQPVVTSYDYDAPLSEAGDVTDKYIKIRALLKEESPKEAVPGNLPSVPVSVGKIAYGEVTITHFITLKDMLPLLGVFFDGHPAGVISRSKVNPVKLLNLEEVKKEIKELKSEDVIMLDILVENQGRISAKKDMISDRKGLLHDVEVNGKVQTDWLIYPLEFKKPFIDEVMAADKWQDMRPEIKVPALYKGSFEIPNRTPKDTFLSMEGWNKGIVFINAFNIGRYWRIGPQRTYYIPGPLLKAGRNEIVIFEQHQSAEKVSFVDKHDLSPTVRRGEWNF